MNYVIGIKRRESSDAEVYFQEFPYEGDGTASVAAVLNELNNRSPLFTIHGEEATPISWDCGCMVRKCGACAMRINGLPRLACATFLKDLQGNKIELAPLGKFPVVRDLVVDRSFLFEKLKEVNLWLKSEAYMEGKSHEIRYQSARCLMCGCCLEICPNFSVEGKFGGAMVPVNAYRILNQEEDTLHFRNLKKEYQGAYYEGCGKSLSCHEICPVGIPVEELMVRSNAVAIWGNHE